eukprot:scaffold118_cov382-Prasinococcus_capsulatus_cf.AAC.1
MDTVSICICAHPTRFQGSGSRVPGIFDTEPEDLDAGMRATYWLQIPEGTKARVERACIERLGRWGYWAAACGHLRTSNATGSELPRCSCASMVL